MAFKTYESIVAQAASDIIQLIPQGIHLNVAKQIQLAVRQACFETRTMKSDEMAQR